ncbi:MAG: ferritin-like domain-containing protein [Spirochaetia bacterium]
MGQRGSEIIGVDKKNLVKMLNEALAEEWLAYYQYWIGARVMEGPMRSEIEPELNIHANQELNHAVMVCDRIVQLGGTPVLTPAKWMELSSCEYGTPEDPYVEVILQQNLDGERCAIQRYSDIANFASGKDHATYQMAVQILNEENEHEQEIEDWLTDIDRMRENFKKLRM